MIRGWLGCEIAVREHSRPAVFDQLRGAYDQALHALTKSGLKVAEGHAQLLSSLTDLLFGDDISATLAARLSQERINQQGVRSALAQGFVKNTGENFINVIVYALADLLSGQDNVLVDKGLPLPVRPFLTTKRSFVGADGGMRVIDIPIECDIAIWHRDRPSEAIVVSAKTRLKEVFHIGTMWKLLYDMLGDDYCRSKWGLDGPTEKPDMLYVFATADMVRPTGTRTQGPDVERDAVRNLIAMDASFFDYVFVSKAKIAHVASTLDLGAGREALFHELGCLVSLISQRFGITL